MNSIEPREVDLSEMSLSQLHSWIAGHVTSVLIAQDLRAATRRLANNPDATTREHEAAKAAVAVWVAACNALYFPYNAAVVERLRERDPRAVEPAIYFLELDPWLLGSGHLKDSLARRLAQVHLDADQIHRLQHVVCAVIERKAGWEFRAYTRLARRRLDSPEFREAVSAKLTAADEGVRLRAKWVLDALARNGTETGPGEA